MSKVRRVENTQITAVGALVCKIKCTVLIVLQMFGTGYKGVCIYCTWLWLLSGEVGSHAEVVRISSS